MKTSTSNTLFAPWFFTLILTLGLSTSIHSTAQSIDDITLNVYKDENCGCCVDWIDHMSTHGFTSTIHHPKNLHAVKAELGILPEWQSCHTAVSKEGYLFEGHIPAKYISQFLASPPENASGLAAPGMPMGSPGMEMGGRFNAYDVILIRKDGSSEVYAHIKNKADQ